MSRAITEITELDSRLQPPGVEQLEIERPKEHGAYAILGVSLVTSFLVAGTNLVGLSVATASILAFVAHEPVMIAASQRGQRAKRESPNAIRHASVLIVLAGLLGSVAMMLGTRAVQMSLIISFLLAVVSFTLSVCGQQRTLLAQLWSVIGLTSPAVVVLMAGGVSSDRALLLGLVWIIGQASAIVSVRSVIAGQRQATLKRIPRLNDMIQFGLLGFTCILLTCNILPALYALPLLLASICLRFFPPPLRQLRRIGWLLVAANVVSALGMVIGERMLG